MCINGSHRLYSYPSEMPLNRIVISNFLADPVGYHPDANAFPLHLSCYENMCVTDRNGTIVQNGDSVILIKDLKVRSMNSTLKR